MHPVKFQMINTDTNSGNLAAVWKSAFYIKRNVINSKCTIPEHLTWEQWDKKETIYPTSSQRSQQTQAETQEFKWFSCERASPAWTAELQQSIFYSSDKNYCNQHDLDAFWPSIANHHITVHNCVAARVGGQAKWPHTVIHPSHLPSAGYITLHFREQNQKWQQMLFLYLHSGATSQCLKYRNSNIQAPGNQIPWKTLISRPRFTDFNLWSQLTELSLMSSHTHSVFNLHKYNFTEYSNCYLTSASKGTDFAREGSHLSVPRVLKDSIPGTTLCLGNVTIIFTAIPPPLPEECSGEKQKKALAAYLYTFCFGLWRQLKTKGKTW